MNQDWVPCVTCGHLMAGRNQTEPTGHSCFRLCSSRRYYNDVLLELPMYFGETFQNVIFIKDIQLLILGYFDFLGRDVIKHDTRPKKLKFPRTFRSTADPEDVANEFNEESKVSLIEWQGRVRQWPKQMPPREMIKCTCQVCATLLDSSSPCRITIKHLTDAYSGRYQVQDRFIPLSYSSFS